MEEETLLMGRAVERKSTPGEASKTKPMAVSDAPEPGAIESHPCLAKHYRH